AWLFHSTWTPSSAAPPSSDTTASNTTVSPSTSEATDGRILTEATLTSVTLSTAHACTRTRVPTIHILCMGCSASQLGGDEHSASSSSFRSLLLPSCFEREQGVDTTVTSAEPETPLKLALTSVNPGERARAAPSASTDTTCGAPVDQTTFAWSSDRSRSSNTVAVNRRS